MGLGIGMGEGGGKVSKGKRDVVWLHLLLQVLNLHLSHYTHRHTHKSFCPSLTLPSRIPDLPFGILATGVCPPTQPIIWGYTYDKIQ